MTTHFDRLDVDRSMVQDVEPPDPKVLGLFAQSGSNQDSRRQERCRDEPDGLESCIGPGVHGEILLQGVVGESGSGDDVEQPNSQMDRSIGPQRADDLMQRKARS